MNDQVLSIKQMQELIELGIDTSKASLFWVESFYFDEKNNYERIITQSVSLIPTTNAIPTFTLQDILEMLPPHKTFSEYNKTYNRCWVRLCSPENDNIHTELSNESLLQAASNMLKWCKQNNFI